MGAVLIHTSSQGFRLDHHERLEMVFGKFHKLVTFIISNMAALVCPLVTKPNAIVFGFKS